MGQLDRDWYHADRDKRDKIPHVTDRKISRKELDIILDKPAPGPELKGQFYTGLIIGLMVGISLTLLSIIILK
ncbi:MAG: hypothetical protein PHE38_12740 [Alishewanella agri]|nr:hypothetical protein [Alishewanella agri]